MKTYNKEFLVDAFCFRYDESELDTRSMREMAEKYYDTVDKAKFRLSCGLDTKEVSRYLAFCEEAGLQY